MGTVVIIGIVIAIIAYANGGNSSNGNSPSKPSSSRKNTTYVYIPCTTCQIDNYRPRYINNIAQSCGSCFGEKEIKVKRGSHAHRTAERSRPAEY